MRFGLIGTGYWAATVHAPGIASHPQAELVGVWGRDPAKTETLATRFGARPFANVDALFGEVEAVAFSVPPDIQADLAVRAAEAGRALLLEKPVALTVEAAERIVEAARAPTVVFFTWRFDPAVRSWFEEEIDGYDWDGGQAILLSSIFEAGNPFGESPWRQTRGALWDIGPHALSLLMPTLGSVEEIGAVRGRGDATHLVLRHASGAASNMTVSLTSPAQLTGAVFWGRRGIPRMPDGLDVAAAYASAIDALIAGIAVFDASFGCDVVRILAAAEERLAAGAGRRPPPTPATT